MEVAAGAAVDVSLTLSADAVPAGEPVTATIAATDAYTNPTSAEDAVLTVSDGASADGMELVATVVGEYSVTVALDELSDEAQWSVTAAAPATIDLVVESSAVEVGDATDVEVIVLDAYGNTAEAELTWTLDPGAVLEEDAIGFEAEGVYVCTVGVTDTDITDSETVTVDSSGPMLLVEEPERAHWTDADELSDRNGLRRCLWSTDGHGGRRRRRPR